MESHSFSTLVKKSHIVASYSGRRNRPQIEAFVFFELVNILGECVSSTVYSRQTWTANGAAVVGGSIEHWCATRRSTGVVNCFLCSVILNSANTFIPRRKTILNLPPVICCWRVPYEISQLFKVMIGGSNRNGVFEL